MRSVVGSRRMWWTSAATAAAPTPPAAAASYLLFVVAAALVQHQFSGCGVRAASYSSYGRRPPVDDQAAPAAEASSYTYHFTRGNYGDIDDVIKRAAASGKGSCTCTCETKPVGTATASDANYAQQRTAPHTTSLLRTGSLLRTSGPAGGGGGSNRNTPQLKSYSGTASQQEQQHQSQAASASYRQPASPGAGRSTAGGIIKVPPMNDYAYDHHPVLTASEDAETNKQKEESTTRAPINNVVTDRRFPWKHLPDTMCFRQMCESDDQCCLRFNICDRSAKVCVDCWYGSSCTQDSNCCLKYPYCEQEWKTEPGGRRVVSGGKCTNERQ